MVWYDWMANLSLPVAHVETTDQFYGTDRMGLSVFGVVIEQYHGPARGTTLKYIVLVSQILDHTALFSGVMLDRVKEFIEDLPSVKHISFWCDCGPHFRAWEHLAYLQKSWFEVYNCVVRLNFFAEKHGKGLVDSLFGHVRRWLRTRLLTPGTLVKVVEELAAVFEKGATVDMQMDPPPHGPEYHVRVVESAQKPATVYRLELKGVHLEKSYCFEVRPYSSVVRTATWHNVVFSDLCGQPAEAMVAVVTETKLTPSERMWRRGHYGSMRWDQDHARTNARTHARVCLFVVC
jgi:hypothetical protein